MAARQLLGTCAAAVRLRRECACHPWQIHDLVLKQDVVWASRAGPCDPAARPPPSDAWTTTLRQPPPSIRTFPLPWEYGLEPRLLHYAPTDDVAVVEITQQGVLLPASMGTAGSVAVPSKSTLVALNATSALPAAAERVPCFIDQQ